MNIPENIIDIIVARSAGEISQTDRKKLDAWLSESPGNKKAYYDLLTTREAVRRAEDWSNIDAVAAWENIQGRHHIHKRRKSLLHLSVAASVAILLGAGVWMSLIRYGPNASEKPVWVPDQITLLTTSGAVVIGDETLQFEEGGATINAANDVIEYDSQSDRGASGTVYNTLLIPRGEQYTLRLADGSKAMLNSESKIRFPAGFPGDTREVYLEGEAYFEIAEDKSKPFVVHTDNADVRVLGTTFNVSSYKDENSMEITLVEGSVNVTAVNNAVLLSPEEQYRLDKSTLEHTVTAVNTHIYTGWTGGMFRYESMPLEILMSRLSKWYDLKYDFRNSDLKQLKFTGGFRKDQDILYILDVLNESTKAKFDYKNETIIIRKK